MDPAVLGDYASGRCGLVDAARRWGVSRAEARALLLREGIVVRRPGRPAGASPFAATLTPEFLRRQYVEGGRSAGDLAIEVGCTPRTVTSYLARYGIARHARARPAISGDQVRHWYLDERRTLSEVARRTGRSRRAVRAVLDERDIRRPPLLMSASQLRDAYVVQGRSTTDIAAEAGCAPATVARRLRQAGVPLRRRGGARRAL